MEMQKWVKEQVFRREEGRSEANSAVPKTTHCLNAVVSFMKVSEVSASYIT